MLYNKSDQQHQEKQHRTSNTSRYTARPGVGDALKHIETEDAYAEPKMAYTETTDAYVEPQKAYKETH